MPQIDRAMLASALCTCLLFISVIFLERDWSQDSHWYVLGTIVFQLIFTTPIILFAAAIIVIVQFQMARRQIVHAWPYVFVWLSVGSLIAYTTHVSWVLALSISFVCGMIYWVLAGRFANRPEPEVEARIAPGLIAKAVLTPIALYMAYVVVGWLFMGGKMLWVTALDPPRGEPPFYTEFERQMTARMKVAMMDFPDVQSCVDQDAGKVTSGKLVLLDWDQIHSYAEEKVCIFRLLATYGDVSMAGDWLAAQGFEVSAEQAKTPFEGRDGNLQVRGSWFIRKKGPRYPTRGFFSRMTIAHSMAVISVWSPDGKTLLWVTLDGTVT